MESRYEEPLPMAERTCEECGHQVTTTWHHHTFLYGAGSSATDLAVWLPVRRCDHCDFDYLDDEGERLKHQAVCRHLGVLTPLEIRRIREDHELSRPAFAKLTGIGEASLSRWENGIKIQTPANDRYLRLLAYPGILALLSQTVSQPPAAEPRQRKFRLLKVSSVVIKRQESFSLRRAA